MHPLTLPKGLIVSVQAPEDSPLRDPDVIAAMADASLEAHLLRQPGVHHPWLGGDPPGVVSGR